ncbi:pre-mRNA-splicing factor Isy1p [[Candida] anglica]|uniref:Pre-mRNA-splicing factor ISY1 n=1 Tax=[Candida] anglica TaxID=148631 RepID=A0ABP0EJJ9_9ASCO
MSANNKEAQSGLNRYLALKNKEAGVLESNPNNRPKYVQNEKSLPQADRWRSTVLGEISSKLTKIQDPAISEFQVRDLNDDLNRLFKEKRAWEYHIKDLGGVDYKHVNNSEVTGIQVNGYRYFGRAKELPDVKEVLEEQKKHRTDQQKRKNTEKEATDALKARERRIDASYYGVYDENSVESVDGITRTVLDQVHSILGDISPSEHEIHNENYTNTSIENDLLEFEKKKSIKLLQSEHKKKGGSSPKLEILPSDIPNASDISKWLVQQRKKELLSKLNKA